MAAITSAVRKGRPATTDIIPGTVVRHFLYKSRGNVQFVMPSYEPHFTNLPLRRRLVKALIHSLQSTETSVQAVIIIPYPPRQRSRQECTSKGPPLHESGLDLSSVVDASI